MLDNIPKVIYKYREWPNEFTKSILTDLKVYFPSPKDFNDPFDVAIPIAYDEMNAYQWEIHFKWIVKYKYLSKGISISNKQLEKEVRNMLRLGKQYDESHIKYAKGEQLNRMHKNVGVFCTTKSRSNITMWSHYANSHKGICLGFDSSSLQNDAECMIGRVNYLNIDNRIPIIIPNDKDPIKDFLGQLIYKSADWKKEDEIRLVSNGHEDGRPRKINISSNSIVEIILGCKMSLENQENIINLVHRKKVLSHVKLFRARESDTFFKLIFEEIV